MKATVIITAFLLATGIQANALNKGENLQDTTINLKEVVVKSKLIKHEPGKDIVDAVQLRKGKTDLIDLLTDVPGLIVTDNGIKIPGTGSVKVMFNGRLKRIPSGQLTQILKSYQASNVNKIEIIKDPGAKYDAEGNFGILNIITDKKQEYLGGSIGDNVSYATNWQNAMRGNLNYSHKRITASLNAGWTYGQSPYKESHVDNYTSITRVSNSNYKPRKNYYNLIGAIDFELDSLSTLGLEASYSSSYAKQKGSNTVKQFSSSGQLTETGFSHSLAWGPPQENLNLSLYLDRKWSRTKKITFIMDAFRFINDGKYHFASDYTDADGNLLDKTDKVFNTDSRHLKGVSGALDFDTKLPWGIKLSTGLKATITSTDNSLNYEYSTLSAQNNDFTYVENIYAGYITMNKSLGQISMRLGGRYEFTHTNAKPQSGDNTTNDYGRLFPNIVIMYNMKNGNSWSVSSRGGIDRPSLKAVNPFKVYTNAYSSVMGNPTISPSHWYNAQVSNNTTLFKGLELSTALRYAKVLKIITQIHEMDGTAGTTTTQWRNAYKKDGCYMDISLYYSGLKWMRASLMTELIYEKSYGNSSYSLPEAETLHPYFYGYFRFYFDKKHNLSATLSGTYIGIYKLATNTRRPIYDVNCSFSYSCLKNKLDLTLRIKNLIASHYKGTAYSNDGMTFVFDNDYYYRRITVGASYSFGKKIRTKRKTHSNSDIEKRF